MLLYEYKYRVLDNKDLPLKLKVKNKTITFKERTFSIKFRKDKFDKEQLSKDIFLPLKEKVGVKNSRNFEVLHK